LQQYYILSAPVQLTRALLWDAEEKKAWDPHRYIPHVVREGQSWGRTTSTEGDQRFLRPEFQTTFYFNSFPVKEFLRFRVAFCSQNLLGIPLTMPSRARILRVWRANLEPFT
jgi:hypothetical protein